MGSTPGARSGPAGGGVPPEAAEGGRRRGGCLLLLLLAGAFFFLLRDFAQTPIAALLAAIGAALAWGGATLAIGALRFVLESPWYAGLWVLGLAMLAGAAATLAPAAPGAWLAQAPPFWGLLDARIGRLEAAIEAGDVGLARTLASRGVGDPAPRDSFGTPLLHLARDAQMIAVLLEAGLDPDARDTRGKTLLMTSGDPEVTRLLLAAGADPNARDEHGFTALMSRSDGPPETIEQLLGAGADVHATSDSGRTVADFVHGPGRALVARHAGGRPLRETGAVAPRGRDDWLVTRSGPVGRPDASGVVLEKGPLRPGDVGSVSILVDNPSPRDRVVELSASLDSGLLFVGASHGGTLDDRRPPGPSGKVRWPWLSLPAGAGGRLELSVLARPDDAVADLAVGGWSLDVRVVDLPERTERLLSLSQERAGPPARVGWDDPRAFVSVLLPAALAFLFWLVFWRRRRGESSADQRHRIGRAVAGACGLLCLALAGELTGSMAEPWWRFEEATCEILDQRVLATEVEGDRSSRRGSTLQAHPLAAVAIEAGGERIVAAGWATTTATRSVAELRAAPVGSTARCWIDPADPRRFTLLRAPPLGGLLGLALVLATAVPLVLIVWRFGRASRPASH